MKNQNDGLKNIKFPKHILKIYLSMVSFLKQQLLSMKIETGRKIYLQYIIAFGNCLMPLPCHWSEILL